MKRWFVLVAAACSAFSACASPLAPTYPGSDQIGPPRPASDDCQPPTRHFAQASFRIADLDRTTTCTGFIEQDECVLALFRDCTEDPTQQRSWQGSIDSSLHIVLTAGYHGAGVIARSPSSCDGLLQEPAGEPPWARLACQIMGGDRHAHAGFYFERADANVAPYYKKTTDNGIVVATPKKAAEDFAGGFVVLQNAGRIFAIASGLSPSGDATGLYMGAPNAAALTKLPLALQAPTVIRASSDERWILVADGTSLYHVDAASGQSDTMVRAAGPIVEMEIVGQEVLVAASAPLMTHLQKYSTASLAPSGADKPVMGEIMELVALPATSSGAIALAMLASGEIAEIDGSLNLGQSFVPEMGSAPDAYALIDASTLALAYGAHYLEIDLGSKMSAVDLMVPDTTQIRALLFDPVKKTVLAGSRGGTVAVIDRILKAGDTVPFVRPVLASEISIPDRGSASKLAYDAKADTFYVLAGSTGVIYPLAR